MTINRETTTLARNIEEVKTHRKLNRSERRFLAAYKHKKYSKR